MTTENEMTTDEQLDALVAGTARKRLPENECTTLGINDLYQAAFVLAKGNRLLKVDDSSPWAVAFHFHRMARVDSEAYFGGGTEWFQRFAS